MKYYFGVIIGTLTIVVFLLFFLLFKIYKLHLKSSSNEEVIDIFEQQELLSSFSGSKESSELSNAFEVKEFSDNTSDSVDLNDGIHGRQEVEFTQIQPDVKELLSSNSSGSIDNIKPIVPLQETLKNKTCLKLMLQYDKQRAVLKVTIKHIEGKMKGRAGSSESYVDVQVSSYQFRTFRNPGYRRPVRALLKKQIEFHLDFTELRTSFLLVFLMRYDPFSRLKIDGEVVVKLTDILSEGFIDGVQSELSKDIMKSKQDFTAFIFRPY